MAYFTLPLLLFAIIRFYFILPKNYRTVSRSSNTCNFAVFLGSGGHTAEALKLVSALNFARYTPRTYIVCTGDILSEEKAHALESAKGTSNYSILKIPRARFVRQSIFTTPFTAVGSILVTIYSFTILPVLQTGSPTPAGVLLINGPGTCFILCAVIYLNKFLGLQAPEIIYVESFARVQSLSISGKLLRPFVDRFIVQWPQTIRHRCEYHGWLV